MSSIKNGFVRFCTSGFGLGSTAAKAAGYTVLLMCIGFVIAYYILKFIIKLIMKLAGKSSAASIPDFKEGPYSLELIDVGDTPDALYDKLQEVTGYDAKLARKVMDSAPTTAIRGLDKEAADAFVIILEAVGAKVHITK